MALRRVLLALAPLGALALHPSGVYCSHCRPQPLVAPPRPALVAAVPRTLGAQAPRRRAGAPRCSEEAQEITLYPRRWLQLAYLSSLALLSDWVCFSVAAAPETWEATYAHDPATLIDVFLLTNVVFCFIEPTVVGRFGLRAVVITAATVMALGCALRSGLPFTGAAPPYAEVRIP